MCKYYKKNESHNSLKFSFTIIRSNCVDYEAFRESDILTLCETNLDDLFDSGNCSVKGCLPLI